MAASILRKTSPWTDTESEMLMSAPGVGGHLGVPAPAPACPPSEARMQEPGLRRVPPGPALTARGVGGAGAQPPARPWPPEFLLTSVFLRLKAARPPWLVFLSLFLTLLARPHGKWARRAQRGGPKTNTDVALGFGTVIMKRTPCSRIETLL